MNTALEQHIEISQSVYALMLEENQALKGTETHPSAEILMKKKELLRQLTESLARVKSEAPASGIRSGDRRSLVEKAQRLILKTLLLDRENEQLLLKHAARLPSKRTDLKLPSTHLQRVYKKHLPTAVALKAARSRHDAHDFQKGTTASGNAPSFHRPQASPS